MEYLIWVALIVLIGVVIIWKYKGGNPTKEEQELENEIVGARSNTFLSRTSDKEDTRYNGVPNPKFREGDMRSNVKTPLAKRPAPPTPPPMRSLGGGRTSYQSLPVAESAPVQSRDSSLDLLTTVVVMDALGVFDSNESAPARDIPPAPADPTPEPAYEPKANTQTDFSSTTDYSEPSRTNSDSGWSSNDRSDSGWSSSSSDSSSYDSGSSSSSSDSSSW